MKYFLPLLLLFFFVCSPHMQGVPPVGPRTIFKLTKEALIFSRQPKDADVLTLLKGTQSWIQRNYRPLLRKIEQYKAKGCTYFSKANSPSELSLRQRVSRSAKQNVIKGVGQATPIKTCGFLRSEIRLKLEEMYEHLGALKTIILYAKGMSGEKITEVKKGLEGAGRSALRFAKQIKYPWFPLSKYAWRNVWHQKREKKLRKSKSDFDKEFELLIGKCKKLLRLKRSISEQAAALDLERLKDSWAEKFQETIKEFIICTAVVEESFNAILTKLNQVKFDVTNDLKLYPKIQDAKTFPPLQLQVAQEPAESKLDGEHPKSAKSPVHQIQPFPPNNVPQELKNAKRENSTLSQFISKSK